MTIHPNLNVAHQPAAQQYGPLTLDAEVEDPVLEADDDVVGPRLLHRQVLPLLWVPLGAGVACQQ
jgi:hypothetical protein